MKNTARLFNCARCHCQVTICSACDRGNIYCNKDCSQLSRQRLRREAAIRYQNSPRGRVKHAKRQHRYRQRKKTNTQIVTHHRSPELPDNDLLPDGSMQPAAPAEPPLIYCHFCGKGCSSLLRSGYLRRHSHDESPFSSSWPRGP
jgi:hypothetical protein